MSRLRILSLLAGLAATALRADSPSDSAVALFLRKDYPAAAEAFRQIADERPDDPAPHFYLGLIAGKRGDNDVAVQELERATRLAPANAEYLIELGDAYGRAAKHAGLFASLGWAKKCAAALEKAVELDPDNLTARNGLVTFYREAPPVAGGGIDKAVAQAEEIRKRDFAMGSVVLAQLYLSEKRSAEAFAAYEAILAVQPDNYQALYLIGRTAAETGENLARGEQALRRCLELAPGPGEQGRAAVEWRLGHIAEKRGDVAGARAWYEASLRSHPGFQQAADSLAKLNS